MNGIDCIGLEVLVGLGDEFYFLPPKGLRPFNILIRLLLHPSLSTLHELSLQLVILEGCLIHFLQGLLDHCEILCDDPGILFIFVFEDP